MQMVRDSPAAGKFVLADGRSAEFLLRDRKFHSSQAPNAPTVCRLAMSATAERMQSVDLG